MMRTRDEAYATEPDTRNPGDHCPHCETHWSQPCPGTCEGCGLSPCDVADGEPVACICTCAHEGCHAEAIDDCASCEAPVCSAHYDDVEGPPGKFETWCDSCITAAQDAAEPPGDGGLAAENEYRLRQAREEFKR